MTDRVWAAFDGMVARVALLPGPWRALSTKQRSTIHLVLLGVSILFVYYRTFEWLVPLWWTAPRYSHGFLIPLIAFYLAWIKRDRLAQLPRRPSFALGGQLLFVSALLLLAGRAGGFVLAEAISFLIFLPGIVLLIWGAGHLRALLLPLAYLQFMIPWTEEFFARASWWFQILSARLASLLLQAMGFSVFREATYLQISHVALEVAPDCSGLGYLYSVLALIIPLVYLTQRTWSRAAVVLSFGVAITILANGARVAFMGVMNYHYGASMLHGPLHIFQGWFVFQVGLLFLFLLNWGATKLPCCSHLNLHERWKKREANVVPAETLPRTTGSFTLLIVTLLILACYLHFFAIPQQVLLKRPLAEFPRIIDGWHAQDSAWIEGSRFFPGAAAETTRVYQTVAGSEIFLYIGYYTSQRQGGSLTGKPSNPIRRDVRELALPTARMGLQRVNQSVPTIDGKRYEALFWYQLPSGNTTGRYETKLRQFADAVIRGHNNGAVVLLATPVSEDRDGAVVVADLAEFATAMAPVIEEYLP